MNCSCNSNNLFYNVSFLFSVEDTSTQTIIISISLSVVTVVIIAAVIVVVIVVYKRRKSKKSDGTYDIEQREETHEMVRVPTTSSGSKVEEEQLW